MTGIYHKPVYRAFRKAGFDTRIVHPFASNHYRQPLHPDLKTDDNDLEAIFHAAVKGYGLATLPVGEVYQSLQALSRHRHNLVKQRSRLMVQIRRLLHQTDLPEPILRKSSCRKDLIGLFAVACIHGVLFNNCDHYLTLRRQMDYYVYTINRSTLHLLRTSEE